MFSNSEAMNDDAVMSGVDEEGLQGSLNMVGH